MWTLIWLITVLGNGLDGLENTDRLVPSSWHGNPWGPEATEARKIGAIPAVPITPAMARWDQWGKTTLRDGDILFRLGDARVMGGLFPFSRFIAKVSGSPFSHTGIAAIEDGVPVVYDTTKAGVRRQPLSVWVLDNIGPFGVKRVKPDLARFAAKAVAFCRHLYQTQPPFDFDFKIDDQAYYCVEMTEKAYRNSGLPLSEPIQLGDMENAPQYPLTILLILQLSHLRLDQSVYFPGNERHGIWSSKNLVTVCAPSGAALPGS